MQGGAEEGLRPGEGDGELLVPRVGVPGGVRMRCHPRLPECSEVLVYLVYGTQASHIPTVLHGL